MDYGIGHAFKGRSYVAVVARDESGKKPEILRLNDEIAKAGKKEKIAFLEGLKPGDRVFLELGGPADRLALMAVAYGADVYRYPSFKLGTEKARQIVDAAGWLVTDERPYGKETGEILTRRKIRAMALSVLMTLEPEGFIKVEERDISILRLKMEFRSFRRAQKGAMRAFQGLISAYFDQALVELAFERQTAARINAEDIHSYVIERLLEDVLGGEVNETDRKDFFALIGKEFKDGRIPERAKPEDIEKIVTALIESDRFHATIFDRLKNQVKRIERLLKGGREKRVGDVSPHVIPANVIWERVFEPIPGCGPLIAARIISTVVDIRRFEERAQLTAFGGYHHFEDGSRARRIAGKVSNWPDDLKQGVFLWTQQIIKMPGTHWRTRLDQRRAYELVKLLRNRQQDADAQGLIDENGKPFEILPHLFRDRVINSVNDFTVEDLAVYRIESVTITKGKNAGKTKEKKTLIGGLLFHVDHLRELAGVKSSSDGEHEGGEEAEAIDEESDHVVKNPALAKLVRGLKRSALDKAVRWLGQQFLKHVYVEWQKAVGVYREPQPRAKYGHNGIWGASVGSIAP